MGSPDGESMIPVHTRYRGGRTVLLLARLVAPLVLIPAAVLAPNVQDQNITDLNVALGKGTVPPVDATLSAFPAASVNTTSDTESIQLKGDLWVLPFLNVYATLGKVRGDASVTVNIDLADAPEICIRRCGTPSRTATTD